MQISVESGEGLERRMTVTLPAEQIDEEVDKRLKRIARNARMDGFRPGKVPFRIVRSRYGSQVRREVFGEMIQSSFSDAVIKEQLHPAGTPQIEAKEEGDDAEFAYTAVFEVLPQFEPAEMKGMKLAKPVAEVSPADVDSMIEKLRKQRVTWNTVTRTAQSGDKVTINFRGMIDGEAFEGGQGDNAPLVIGSKSMIPGFEDGLIGAAAGENRTLDLKFPEDYRAKTLAGKAASFEVEILEVAEPVLPELNEEFAKMFGVEDGGIDKFRSDIKDNMDRELAQRIKAKIKGQAMDALLEANQIDIPKVLVEEEIENLRNQTRQQLSASAGSKMELPADLFREQAKRRVALGLIVAEVVKRNEIKVDTDRVSKSIEEIAASYEQPEEVVKHYYANQDLLRSVENVVLEEQVVDWVIGQVDIVEENTSFEALTESAE